MTHRAYLLHWSPSHSPTSKPSLFKRRIPSVTPTKCSKYLPSSIYISPLRRVHPHSKNYCSHIIVRLRTSGSAGAHGLPQYRRGYSQGGNSCPASRSSSSTSGDHIPPGYLLHSRSLTHSGLFA